MGTTLINDFPQQLRAILTHWFLLLVLSHQLPDLLRITAFKWDLSSGNFPEYNSKAIYFSFYVIKAKWIFSLSGETYIVELDLSALVLFAVRLMEFCVLLNSNPASFTW